MNDPVNESVVAGQDQRDAEQLQALYMVSNLLKEIVAEGQDIGDILPRILREVLKALHAFSVSLIAVNAQAEPQDIWQITEEGPKVNEGPFLDAVVDSAMFAAAMNGRQTIVVDTRFDERWPHLPGYPTDVEPCSAICCPLVVRSHPVAALTVVTEGANQFGGATVAWLEAIANQVAGVFESTYQYENSRQHTAELAALVSATATISTSLDVNAVLQGVAEQLVNLVDVDACAIFEWDESNRRLEQAIIHRAPWRKAPLRPLLTLEPADYPMVEQGLQSFGPLHVLLSDPELTVEERSLLVKSGVNALLMLPLAAHEQLIGLAVLVETRKSHRFGQQEINLAQMLANQAGTAMQNARLYEDTQRQLKVSALLNQASQVINSTLDTNQILQSLLSQMNELLNAEAISIALVDQQRNELVYQVAEGIGSDQIVGLRLPSNQGISGWVMEHGKPTLVNDTGREPRFNKEGDRRTGYNTAAMICAPLQVKGEVLGTIQAINPRQGRFTEDDLQLLINLANLASSALANAQHFARTQAAEARYSSLFDDSVNPILLTDPAGQIVEANRPAYDFLGCSDDELLGQPLAELHPPGKARDQLPDYQSIDDEEVQVFVSQVRVKNKPDVSVEVHVKRTFSGDNEELLQWIYRDISQELELEEMREDLMAMLVHDLQSPLGNVISSLELMRYELPPDTDPVLLSIVDIAARSSARLQTLIRSLLDITRLEAGHPITDAGFVDVSTLIQEARELVEPALERRQATLVVEVAAGVPEAFVDDDMIRRVLINLLDNAAKYTPEGRRVTVKVQQSDEGEMLLTTVSDQGSGIPEEYREIIFDKFRRLQDKDAPKGMGLGLAFCRLAIEAHGGKIWIDDTPGGGARFNFTLPTRDFQAVEAGDR